MKFGIQLSTKSQGNNSTTTTRCHYYMQFLPLCRTLNKRGLWRNREVISVPFQMPNKVGCVILSWLGSWVKFSQIASVQNNLASGIHPFKLPREGIRKLNPSRPDKTASPGPCALLLSWKVAVFCFVTTYLPRVFHTRYIFCGNFC